MLKHIGGHKQGDVYFAKLQGTAGSVQHGVRPVVIMQNDMGNRFSPTVTVVPLTSKTKASHLPTHRMIYPDGNNGLKAQSILLGEQITTIPVECMMNRIGRLSKEDFSVAQEAVLRQIASV